MAEFRLRNRRCAGAGDRAAGRGLLGFAGVGVALANVAPIVFSAGGRLPDLAPGIGIAAVSTAGYCGFLAGPPLIGLVAEASGLPVALGLVAGTAGPMAAPRCRTTRCMRRLSPKRETG